MYRHRAYLPHEAVAEVSSHNEPIGKGYEIPLIRDSSDLGFNWFEIQLISVSVALKVNWFEVQLG